MTAAKSYVNCSNSPLNSRIRRAGTFCAMAVLGLAILAGCNRDEALDAFRSGASDQLQAGVSAILNGVVNGAFAAFDLKNGDSGSANTSGATAGTSTTSTTTDSTTNDASGSTP